MNLEHRKEIGKGETPSEQQPELFSPGVLLQGQQREAQAQRRTEQELGCLTFDGDRYTYDGYIVDGDHYIPCHVSFTAHEAGLLPGCDLERVRVMIDTTGRDPIRQSEIRIYGKRIWHSMVRPERAYVQALDWALSHYEARVAYMLPFSEPLFRDDPVQADIWIWEVRTAYQMWCKGDREPLTRLLLKLGATLPNAPDSASR